MGVPEVPVVIAGVFIAVKFREVKLFHKGIEFPVVFDHKIFRAAKGDDAGQGISGFDRIFRQSEKVVAALFGFSWIDENIFQLRQP